MGRWFYSIQAVGTPNDVLQSVRTKVRQLACGDVIPVVYFEKKSRSEFYVFIGVEAEPVGGVPETLSTLCGLVRYQKGITASGFIGHPLFPPCTIEQIRSSLDPQEFDTAGSDCIPYLPRWVHDPGDLVDFSEPGEAAATDPARTARFDQLLTWLSSAAEGRWETFLRACQTLGVADDAQGARSVFRRLSLLGHVETSADAREWVICPPVFVRAAASPTHAFWCGQRTPHWRQALGAVVPDDQPGSQAPSRLTVERGDVQRGPPVGEARFQWPEAPVSDLLASHLPDLDGWQRSLQPVIGLTNRGTFERWAGQRFAPDGSFVVRDGCYHGDAGLYCVTCGDGPRQARLMFYFDPAGQRLLRGDWYGLRFLALRRAGEECTGRWNSNGTLHLHAAQRWPMIYERTLVLCSGLLPEQLSGGRLRYRDIPQQTAQQLAGKLGVHLEVDSDA